MSTIPDLARAAAIEVQRNALNAPNVAGALIAFSAMPENEALGHNVLDKIEALLAAQLREHKALTALMEAIRELAP